MQPLGQNCDQCNKFFWESLQVGKCLHFFCKPCISEIAVKAFNNPKPTACYACDKKLQPKPESKLPISFEEVSGQKTQIKNGKGIEPSNSLPEDLNSLIEKWTQDQYATSDQFQKEFKVLLENITKSFFEKKLSAEDIKKLSTGLEDFKKELQSPSQKTNQYDFLNILSMRSFGEPSLPITNQIQPQEEVKSSFSIDILHWEYLNFVLNVLNLNVPNNVLNHCSYHPDLKKDPNDIRTDAANLVYNAYKNDSSKSYFLLRPTTRARGTDLLKKFTLTYCIDGNIGNYRAGYKPQTDEWVPIGVYENNEEKIGNPYEGNPNLEGFIQALLEDSALIRGLKLKTITPVMFQSDKYTTFRPLDSGL